MNTHEAPSLLSPANIYNITQKYSDLFQEYPQYPQCHTLVFKNSTREIEGWIPLKKHHNYGITGMHFVERYDGQGLVKGYNYEWKCFYPIKGIQLSHIISWGNEPHDAPGTAPSLKTKTEPHHCHYCPNDRRLRRENYTVRSLDMAFTFIAYYIKNDDPYDPNNPYIQ
ncbi:DUF6516 family protein [Sporolactobacillus sp. Y61]|uniref:DUF6516 family protein n=1 Tax=Sporolactobacillus sp. Y61 TaxID=3160863 RepID=A0AAU8IIJ9_9BACL